MTRITRYGRKVKTTFISTMFAACIAIVIGIPFVSKNMFNNDVGYYSISIRGTHVGAANTEEEVNVYSDDCGKIQVDCLNDCIDGSAWLSIES